MISIQLTRFAYDHALAQIAYIWENDSLANPTEFALRVAQSFAKYLAPLGRS